MSLQLKIRPILKSFCDLNQKVCAFGCKKAIKKQKSPEKERSPKRYKIKRCYSKRKRKKCPKRQQQEKKSIPRKTTRRDKSKKQDVEKEELKGFLDVNGLDNCSRLVKGDIQSSTPEGFDLCLWGDLHYLFEPDNDDEIRKDQHEYNLYELEIMYFCAFIFC
ncbi:hypothetical protein Tco_0796862 [Tanacetum coccineum]